MGTERRNHGRKDAMEAKCIDCTYWPDNPGTWRQQVATCTVTSCPLWPVRPTTKAGQDMTLGPKSRRILAARRSGTEVADFSVPDEGDEPADP